MIDEPLGYACGKAANRVHLATSLAPQCLLAGHPNLPL